MEKVALGMKVRDRITGVTGIVIARTEWLNQCARLTVQPQETKDGKPVDSTTFDEVDLEIIEHETEFSLRTNELAAGRAERMSQPEPARIPARTGGPQPEPSRR